jgi:putative transport protein
MDAPALVDLLRANTVPTLFALLGAGYLVGRIRIGPIALGPVGGALLVSLVLGRYGFSITPSAQAVGFALFIFSVGHQAGPRFFEVLKTQGLRYLALAAFVAAVGFAAAAIAGRILQLPYGATAGLLAGAMTTTPTLAAAQEAVRSGVVHLPAGHTVDGIVATIATSYAITYIVGLLGIIAAVRLLPRIVGVDLAAEARAFEQSSGQTQALQLQARAYRVARDDPRPIDELRARYWDRLAVVRLRRGSQWIRVADAGGLKVGDEIHAYGDASFFRGGVETLGGEIPVTIEFAPVDARVVVARRDVVGKSLAELDLPTRHGSVVSAIKRDGLMLTPSAALTVRRGDVLDVVGPAESLQRLGDALGPVESDTVTTDMTAFAFGIAMGAIIGLLSITIVGVPIGLGAAGGLLAAGIALGWLNAVRPTVGAFPEAARWILMEFGLMIFIVGVGLQAGSTFLETFMQAGAALVIASVFVVTLPVVAGYFFGRKVLGLSPLLLLGALTGAMTSAAAMSIVNAEAKSSIPALGYTGTYAFANVILAVAGTLIMLL